MDIHKADLAIVLAAGGATRMGCPKGLLRLRGVPLLTRHTSALAPWCRHCVAVLGANAQAHLAHLGPAEVILNSDWERQSPIDSIALALHAHPEAHEVWITPVDTPPATATTLQRLSQAQLPAVPCFEGAQGHPVRVGPEIVSAIRAGHRTGGLRNLLHQATRVAVQDRWVPIDFNTPERWRWFASEWFE